MHDQTCETLWESHPARASQNASRFWEGFRALLLMTLGVFAFLPNAQAKPKLSILSTQNTAQLPTANAGFPHPEEPGQLFFLQRTLNANTVVYTARFDANGHLDATAPIAVYWRRFADAGAIMPLRWYERLFGFGVRLTQTSQNQRFVTFNALKEHRLELRQTGPFSAALFTRQNNQDYQLIYAYLDVDDSGLLPKVTGLRLYTRDPQTGLYVTHNIAVSGGTYSQ
ncbi:DUF4833 domain-containing protein [Shimia marina]|uniref:DUF4833 domain-containing protein n=1 Tax=Shimia marina TaxID=321267 RepID=A0A0P1ELS4_9RHOB|nr:DUF4833 domain-containing protein [Shimia marina]CUH51251.1 hypothetical protein SHM7688_00685 [Shimia marina]SFD53949.1 protein of unknown function [Shimia marina]